jgi:neutral trehalase
MDWKPTYDPVIGFPEKRADYRLFWKVVSIDFRNFLHSYDSKTIYDKDYFIVKDAGFNTIYVQYLQAMATLCTMVNDPGTDYYKALAKKVIQSILEVMYDDESAAFYDVYGKDNEKIKILTPTIFFPVVINEIPEAISKKVIETHFFNKKEFGAPFTIPSEAMNHPSFNPHQSMYIWRGPTWVVYNWFMHQFLMEKGFKEEAGKLVISIKKLIRKSGFREYYNPFTGEEYSTHDFTWAGLVVDMMNMEEGKGN